ncbi:hypothetical protein Ssi02_41470 [Sinosporangium siamense]|uniref:Uncharacterized protein n=1 Tax=Sinosporangium siamense TaxID=1367973 RepID=A0A919V879_9ACTN|nr:hypothetical protein Ssi02_41470 [Sinosporangium siamense]
MFAAPDALRVAAVTVATPDRWDMGHAVALVTTILHTAGSDGLARGKRLQPTPDITVTFGQLQ